jgi:hypothetical protein
MSEANEGLFSLLSTPQRIARIRRLAETSNPPIIQPTPGLKINIILRPWALPWLLDLNASGITKEITYPVLQGFSLVKHLQKITRPQGA